MTRQDLTEAIQAVVCEFSREHDHIPVGDTLSINSGHCREFADDVLSYLGQPANVQQCSAGYYHTWLLRDEAYYDAECPHGVEDPSQLPIWDRLADEEYQCAVGNCSILPERN